MPCDWYRVRVAPLYWRSDTHTHTHRQTEKRIYPGWAGHPDGFLQVNSVLRQYFAVVACDCMRSHAIACDRMQSHRRLSDFLKIHREREAGLKVCLKCFFDNCEQIYYHFFFRLSQNRRNEKRDSFFTANVFLPDTLRIL